MSSNRQLKDPGRNCKENHHNEESNVLVEKEENPGFRRTRCSEKNSPDQARLCIFFWLMRYLIAELFAKTALVLTRQDLNLSKARTITRISFLVVIESL